MKNPVNIALIALIIVLIGFTIYKNTGGTTSTAEPVDAEGYTVIERKDTPVKKLEKHAENNRLIESGQTLDGLKTGAWTSYYPDGRIKSISSYLAGKLDGVQIDFTDKGRVELQAFYIDGLLHGNWATYSNGSRKKEERAYNMGKMDGMNRHYSRTGKLQKVIGFKNDVQHGIFKQYDEDGNVILEYEYKNGEKISGGIVKE
jgi:antitoxin component YwqK of YwqJK toxin-antitoxin module